jgi:hypothetical protein
MKTDNRGAILQTGATALFLHEHALRTKHDDTQVK